MGCNYLSFLYVFSESILYSFMAKFCCSIELEPRTLKQEQLEQAMEVAVGIIHKEEPEEASNIFVEEIKPVSAIKEMARVLRVVQEPNKQEKEEDYSNDVNGTIPCQCSCNSSSSLVVNSPDQSKYKEPLSAPF